MIARVLFLALSVVCIVGGVVVLLCLIDEWTHRG